MICFTTDHRSPITPFFPKYFPKLYVCKMISNQSPSIRSVQVIRYVTPLREGGSLPAIAEADDEFLYVIKFRGAGQGPKALIAELLGGEIARAAGLRVPEIVFASLDEAFGRTEPDEEIQDLLKASTGLNLGIHFLKGAAAFDPVATPPDPFLASLIVWLDCYITNVDRTAKNTNMLWWNKELWLIDHGAALYFHHSWDHYREKALQPFTRVKDHVLLPFASDLIAAGELFHKVINPDFIRKLVSIIPEEWLLQDTPFENAEANRNAYAEFLIDRLKNSDTFTQHAIHAREAII